MYGQQRCWVNKKGCALSLARLLVVVVGPEFQKKMNLELSVGKASPFLAQWQKGVPARLHRGSRSCSDLSVNFLRDAKISQEGKGQHSCWSRTKIRFSQSLEERSGHLDYLSKIIIKTFCKVGLARSGYG